MPGLDPMHLPHDLTTLSSEEIAELGARIAERAEAIASADELTDADIDEIEALGEAKAALDAESASRLEAANAKKSRLEAARAKINGAKAEGDDDGEVVTPDEVITPVAVAATTEAPVPVAATPQALATKRPAAVEPKSTRPTSVFSATAFSVDPETTVYDDPMALARALTKKRLSFGHIPAGIHDEYVRIATMVKPDQGYLRLGADAGENTTTLEQVRREAESLVAAGGIICAPLEPSYDFFELGEVCSSVESSIPVVRADRGGIQYIPYMGIPNQLKKPLTTVEAAGAAALGQHAITGPMATGVTGNAVVPGGTPVAGQAWLKACATIDCPPIAACYVDAFSQCLKFDNLQYRIFPELVAEFQRMLTIAYASVKEQFYLDQLFTGATVLTEPVTGTAGLEGIAGQSAGVLAKALFFIDVAAIRYRRKHYMCDDAALLLYLPSVLKLWFLYDQMIRCDVNPLEVNLGALDAALRDRNLNVVWYGDEVDPAQPLRDDIRRGALPGLPTDFHGLLTAPGAVVRLDGGTLDLGIVRDSVLNQTNDFQIFQEEWLGVCTLGVEKFDLEFKINPADLGVAQACS